MVENIHLSLFKGNLTIKRLFKVWNVLDIVYTGTRGFILTGTFTVTGTPWSQLPGYERFHCTRDM